jgi:hypothetical protein
LFARHTRNIIVFCESSGLEETIVIRETQLKELSFELIQLEETNNLYLQSKSTISKVDGELSTMVKKIEAVRWSLVHMRCEDSSEVEGGVASSTGDKAGTGCTAVTNDVAEETMKEEVSDLIRCKMNLDISREMEEVVYQRIFNKLESLRKKYKVSAKNKADVVTALAAHQAAGKPPTTSGGGGGGGVSHSPSGDSDSDSESDADDDQDPPSESDADTEEGRAKAESRRAAVKTLKKKMKKQKMLIDLLRNQITNLGHKPISEIVTYQKAENNLQNALTRLMDGDETASDDFDKWDEFVRNHPEYKAKQLRLKERFKRENLAVNKAALRMFRTLVPPGKTILPTLGTIIHYDPFLMGERSSLQAASSIIVTYRSSSSNVCTCTCACMFLFYLLQVSCPLAPW